MTALCMSVFLCVCVHKGVCCVGGGDGGGGGGGGEVGCVSRGMLDVNRWTSLSKAHRR